MDTTLRPPWWVRLGGPRAKWLVIGAWVLAALALGPLQPRLQEATVNDPAVFLPAEAESTQVLELLGERFASGRTTPALVVYRNVNGLSEEDEAAIAEDVEAFASVDGAQGVVSPLAEGAGEAGLRSQDGTVAVAVVPLDASTIERIEPAVGELRAIAGDGRAALESWVTGPAGVSVDAVDVFGEIDATLLVATTVLILVLLLGIYRSPAVALVPLAVVALAYAVAAGVVYALVTQAGLDVNGQATGILIILMFGAGTDYCLLIVARFREELARVEDKHEAMAETLRHTSPAILSSGGTTALALLTLAVADLGSIRSAGSRARAGDRGDRRGRAHAAPGAPDGPRPPGLLALGTARRRRVRTARGDLAQDRRAGRRARQSPSPPRSPRSSSPRSGTSSRYPGSRSPRAFARRPSRSRAFVPSSGSCPPARPRLRTCSWRRIRRGSTRRRARSPRRSRTSPRSRRRGGASEARTGASPGSPSRSRAIRTATRRWPSCPSSVPPPPRRPRARARPRSSAAPRPRRRTGATPPRATRRASSR